MAAKARLLERVETPNLCHVANAHGPQLPHLFLRLRVGIVMKPAITHLERAQQEDQAQQAR